MYNGPLFLRVIAGSEAPSDCTRPATNSMAEDSGGIGIGC